MGGFYSIAMGPGVHHRGGNSEYLGFQKQVSALLPQGHYLLTASFVPP